MIIYRFYYLPVDAGLKVFNTLCSSYYRGYLLNLTSNNIKNIDSAWKVCFRKILNISPRTHCNLLQNLIYTISPSVEISTRMVKFVNASLYNYSELVLNVFHNNILNGIDTLSRNISLLHQTCKLSLVDTFKQLTNEILH